MEKLLLTLFPAMMVFAVFSDLLTLKIPNFVSLVLVCVYLTLSAWLGTPWQLVAAHIGCGLVVLSVGFVLFETRVIGGEDAKLASATALWLGFGNLIEYAFVFSIIGGALAGAILFVRFRDHGEEECSIPLLGRLANRMTTHMPYGVALGAAGIALYPHTTIWQNLIGI